MAAVRYSVFFATVAFLTIVCCFHTLAAEIPQNERRSGTAFMSRDTQAMQEDDRANPGMRAVLVPNSAVPPFAAAVPDAVISRLAELRPLVERW